MALTRIALVLLLTALAVPFAHERAGESAAAYGIVAVFDVQGETFAAHVENPATIQQVKDLEAGQSTATIPVGRLRAGTEYNTGWSWHTDPMDIQMAELATEVCDGLPSYVEADQDYWINTVQYFCPWSAVLVDVIQGVGGTTELAAPVPAGSLRERTHEANRMSAAGAGALAICALAMSVFVLRKHFSSPS